MQLPIFIPLTTYEFLCDGMNKLQNDCSVCLQTSCPFKDWIENYILNV